MVQTSGFINKGVLKISSMKNPKGVIKEFDFCNTNFRSYRLSIPNGLYQVKLITAQKTYVKTINYESNKTN